VQTGLTGIIEGQRTADVEADIAAFERLVGGISGWKCLEGDPGKLAKAVTDFLAGIEKLERDPMETRISELGLEPFRTPLGQLKGSLTTIVGLTETSPPPTAAVYERAIDAAIKAGNIAEKAYAERVHRDEVEYFKRLLDKSASSGSGALKVGSFFVSGSTIAFGTLTYSLGERLDSARTNLRSAVFVTASELVPLASEPAPTGRLGIGYLFGDPDRVVTSLSVASFVSPSALDAEASISLKVGASPEEKREQEPTLDLAAWPAWQDRQKWIANREPHLMDHIRPGDLWLGGNIRSISNSNSSSGSGSGSGTGPNTFPNSTALEASLTYALRQRSYENDKTQSPIAATTLALTGTYCAQHLLGVDELGVEFRTPIGGHGLHAAPIYFSARYGTRSDFTLAVETRF